MALVAAIIEEDRARDQVPRYFRDRTNIFDHYSDEQLIHDFRFPKSTILEVIQMCNRLEPKQHKGTDIPVHIQVLCTLRFFARAVFQDDGKDIVGVSQQSFGKCIHRVTSVLCDQAAAHIYFPNNPNELSRIKAQFYSKYGMPNVVGLIDGSHVFITAPSVDEPLYVCHKRGHALNVQFICDADAVIRNVVAKWPGATHDAFIWSNCGLREKFKNDGLNGYLLGDSGYGNEPWLQTPYESTPTRSHANYNMAHKQTRSLVERSIGLWKNCFRRFHKTGGAMQYKPLRACKFIVASVVLHNMRRKLRLPEDEQFLTDPLFEFDEDNNNYVGSSANDLLRAGNQVRDQIRENFFNF